MRAGRPENMIPYEDNKLNPAVQGEYAVLLLKLLEVAELSRAAHTGPAAKLNPHLGNHR